MSRKGHSFPYNSSTRRFVLTDEYLERFHPKSGQSKGKLLFAAGCSVREEAKPANSFAVACGGGVQHLLQAASAAERTEWVADIRWRMERPQREAQATAEAAEAKAKVQAEAREAMVKAEAEARGAKAIGATPFDSLLFLESKCKVAEAEAPAAVAEKEKEVERAKQAGEQAVASANQAVEAAKQAGDWEAAKEAQQASKEVQ